MSSIETKHIFLSPLLSGEKVLNKQLKRRGGEVIPLKETGTWQPFWCFQDYVSQLEKGTKVFYLDINESEFEKYKFSASRYGCEFTSVKVDIKAIDQAVTKIFDQPLQRSASTKPGEPLLNLKIKQCILDAIGKADEDSESNIESTILFQISRDSQLRELQGLDILKKAYDQYSERKKGDENLKELLAKHFPLYLSFNSAK